MVHARSYVHTSGSSIITILPERRARTIFNISSAQNRKSTIICTNLFLPTGFGLDLWRRTFHVLCAHGGRSSSERHLEWLLLVTEITFLHSRITIPTNTIQSGSLLNCRLTFGWHVGGGSRRSVKLLEADSYRVLKYGCVNRLMLRVRVKYHSFDGVHLWNRISVWSCRVYMRIVDARYNWRSGQFSYTHTWG